MKYLWLSLMILLPSIVLAKPQRVCVNGKGQLVVRPKCRNSQSELTLSSLSVAGAVGPQGVPGPQGQPGPQGPQGLPGVSDLQVADSSIATFLNACVPGLDPAFMCMVPGYTTRQAICPANTLLIKSWCVTRPKAGVVANPTRVESADGTSVSCNWSNNGFGPVPGEYYARALCLPAPAL